MIFYWKPWKPSKFERTMKEGRFPLIHWKKTSLLFYGDLLYLETRCTKNKVLMNCIHIRCKVLVQGYFNSICTSCMVVKVQFHLQITRWISITSFHARPRLCWASIKSFEGWKLTSLTVKVTFFMLFQWYKQLCN